MLHIILPARRRSSNDAPTMTCGTFLCRLMCRRRPHPLIMKYCGSQPLHLPVLVDRFLRSTVSITSCLLRLFQHLAGLAWAHHRHHVSSLLFQTGCMNPKSRKCHSCRYGNGCVIMVVAMQTPLSSDSRPKRLVVAMVHREQMDKQWSLHSKNVE